MARIFSWGSFGISCSLLIIQHPRMSILFINLSKPSPKFSKPYSSAPDLVWGCLGWNLQEPGLLLMSWLLVSPPQVATQSASVSSSLVRTVPLSDDICCTTREALSRHSSCLRWTTHLVLLVLSHAFFIHLKYSKVICASKNIKEMPTLSNSWVCSLAGYGRTGESGDETPQW